MIRLPRIHSTASRQNIVRTSLQQVAGFTLIEILLAMGALAIIVAGTLHFGSQMIVNVEQTQKVQMITVDLANAINNYQSVMGKLPTSVDSIVQGGFLPPLAQLQNRASFPIAIELPPVSATNPTWDSRLVRLVETGIPEFAGKVTMNAVPFEASFTTASPPNPSVLKVTLYLQRKYSFASFTDTKTYTIPATVATQTSVMDIYNATAYTVFNKLAASSSQEFPILGQRQIKLLPGSVAFECALVKGALFNDLEYDPNATIPDPIRYQIKKRVVLSIRAKDGAPVGAPITCWEKVENYSISVASYALLPTSAAPGMTIEAIPAGFNQSLASIPDGTYDIILSLETRWFREIGGIMTEVNSCGYSSAQTNGLLTVVVY